MKLFLFSSIAGEVAVVRAPSLVEAVDLIWSDIGHVTCRTREQIEAMAEELPVDGPIGFVCRFLS